MLESLHRRKRGKRAAEALDALRNGRAAPPPFSLLDCDPPPRARAGRVSRSFADRLTDEQRAEISRRLPDEQRAKWDRLDDDARAELAAPLALAYEVPGVEQATGLSQAMPPPDVHAMTHAIEATGGPFTTAIWSWKASPLRGRLSRRGTECSTSGVARGASPAC